MKSKERKEIKLDIVIRLTNWNNIKQNENKKIRQEMKLNG